MVKPANTSNAFPAQKLPLAQLITDVCQKQDPEPVMFWDADPCFQNARGLYSCLSKAISVGCTELFTSYISWIQAMMESHKIPVQALIDDLCSIKEACVKLLPAEHHATIKWYINESIAVLHNRPDNLPSYLRHDKPLFVVATRYLSFMLQGNQRKAQELITNLANDGEPLASIYENIFQATQYEIGRLWQNNKITVAHEHYCTAATQS
ncbi:MAG: B12-binding domain-containing protein [Chitinophagaceae bacterium]